MADGSGRCGRTVAFVSSGYKLDRAQLGRAGSARLGPGSEAGPTRRGAGWWFGDADAMEVPDSGAVWWHV